MKDQWKTIAVVPVRNVKEDDEFRGVVDVNKNSLELQKRIRKEDITKHCTVTLVKSTHSSGYYCAIKYQGKTLMALGLDEISSHIIRYNKFIIEKAPGASVSFHVMKLTE